MTDWTPLLDQVRDFLVFAIRALKIVGIVVFLSLALALCSPIIQRILNAVMQLHTVALGALRQRAVALRLRIRGWWVWRHDYYLPWGRLCSTLDNLGGGQLATLKWLDSNFSKSLREAAAIKEKFVIPNLDFVGVKVNSQKFTKYAIYMAFVGVGTGLIVFLNTYLLSLFFQVVLGGTGILPFKFVTIYYHQLFAFLFSILELMTGIFFHLHEESEHPQTASAMLMRLGPWIGMLSLVLIEVVAYAHVSARLNAAEHLGVPPDSIFFWVVQNFMAFFGAGITFALIQGGYFLWKQGDIVIACYDDWSWNRKLSAAEKLLARAKLTSKDLASQADALGKKSGSMAMSLEEEFSKALGKKDEYLPVIEMIRKKVEASEYRLGRSRGVGPRFIFLLVISVRLGLVLAAGLVVTFSLLLFRSLSFVASILGAPGQVILNMFRIKQAPGGLADAA